MMIFLNGKFVKEKDAKVSVFDHGFLYGDAIYETLKFENGEILNVSSHLKRLKKSAKAVMLPVPWKDSEFNEWMVNLVKMNKLKTARIRLTLTRGKNNFEFLHTKKLTICIFAQKMKSESVKNLNQGVKVITFSVERSLPEIKSTNMLPVILARQEIEKKKVFEAILVDRDGFAREGTITNFYIVKNNVLITPDKGILKGTAREEILKKAKKFMKIELRDVKKEELFAADACFLSNAPRGIIPVGWIDGRKVKNVLNFDILYLKSGASD